MYAIFNGVMHIKMTPTWFRHSIEWVELNLVGVQIQIFKIIKL